MGVPSAQVFTSRSTEAVASLLGRPCPPAIFSSWDDETPAAQVLEDPQQNTSIYFLPDLFQSLMQLGPNSVSITELKLCIFKLNFLEVSIK